MTPTKNHIWLPCCLLLASSTALAQTPTRSPLPDRLNVSVGGYRQVLVRNPLKAAPPGREVYIRGMPVTPNPPRIPAEVWNIELPEFPKVLVIVTTRSIVEESTQLGEYVKWRIAGGWTVIVGTEPDWDQPTSRDWDDRAARIRGWLRTIYETRGAGYALLIGNPDPDGRGIPMRRMEPMAQLLSWFPPSLADSIAHVPTDHYYADLESDWDCDGDRTYGEYPSDSGPAASCADWGPELIVGRIPAYHGVEEVDRMLRAILEFERAPDKSYRDTALFAGAFGGFRGQASPGGDGSTYPADEDLAVFLDRTADDLVTNGTVMPLRLFEDDGIIASGFTHEAPLTYAELAAQWMTGASTLAWGGHGSSFSSHRMVWKYDENDNELADSGEVEAPAFVDSAIAGQLTGAPLAVVHMMSCLNGFPEYPNNLGSALLGRGAIATVSASRSAVGVADEPWEPRPELAGATDNSYYFVMLVQAGGRIGDALAYTKWGLPGNGWAAYDGMSYDVLNAYAWLTKLEYNLYGDPTVTLERCQSALECDDQLPCNGTETCDQGYCVHHDPIECSNTDADPCTTQACDNTTGQCVAVPVFDGLPCDDHLWCTTEDLCQDGVCGGTPRECNETPGYVSECSETARDCLLHPIESPEEPSTGCQTTPGANGWPVWTLLVMLGLGARRRSRFHHAHHGKDSR